MGSRPQTSLVGSGPSVGTALFASRPIGLVQSRLRMPSIGLKRLRLSDESILDHQNKTGRFFRPRLEFASDIQVGEISHQKTLKTKYSVNLGSLAAGLTLGGLYTSKFLQTHGGYRSQGLSFAKLASCLFCCVVVQ